MACAALVPALHAQSAADMDSLYIVVAVGAMAAGFVQGLSGFG